MPDNADFILRLLLFAGVHSLFAATRVKAFVARKCGGEPRSFRLVYNLASLAFFSWVMAAYRGAPVLYSVQGPWRWLQYGGQAAAALAVLLCVRQTGSGDFLGIDQIRCTAAPRSRLVTSGWYSRCRHPLYLYSTLFLLLTPKMTVHWALLTLFSVLYFIIGALIEERRLLKEFGSEYLGYRQRVPFLLPSLPLVRRRSPHRDQRHD